MTGLYLTNDLLFSSRVAGAALASQLNVELCLTTERLLERSQGGDVGLILIDLSFPGVAIEELVPQLRQNAPTSHVVAYGPHVQAERLGLASQVGCDQVLSRGQFQNDYVQLLHRFLAK